jgi:DNA-directed RNA polymerase specialized sigma24 family protein
VAWRRVSRADDPDAYLRRILVNASHRRFRRRRVTEQPGDPPETPVEPAAFCVVAQRKYAAFIVPNPLRLAKLTWFDARGQAIASTTALPRYGYAQFQP